MNQQRMLSLPKSSLDEKIIDVIAASSGLTAKQIHFRLQRELGLNQTYQATHKKLKQLAEGKVLVKTGNTYSISEEWAEKARKNVEMLSEKVSGRLKEINLDELAEGESKNLVFDGILDVGWFLADKVISYENPEKTAGLALWRFCYSIVGLDEKHYAKLKEGFSKNEWHAMVEEDNKVDHMFADTLKEYGIKEVKFGVKCATKLSDKMIIGPYIVEIVYPGWFRKGWELQNRLPRKLVQFAIGKHIQVMRDPKVKIQVIVTRNKLMAEEYRKEYI